MNLRFEFTSSPAPVQAEGTVEGRSFYFRARGDTWQFTVAERAGDDPVTLGKKDVAHRWRGWYLASKNQVLTSRGEVIESWLTRLVVSIYNMGKKH